MKSPAPVFHSKSADYRTATINMAFISSGLLFQWLDCIFAVVLLLQGVPLVGLLVWALPWVRDRMVADPRFLFKVIAEVAIDLGKRVAPEKLSLWLLGLPTVQASVNCCCSISCLY